MNKLVFISRKAYIGSVNYKKKYGKLVFKKKKH